MSWNPPLVNGAPEPIGGEAFFCERRGMILECTAPDTGINFSIYGRIILTTLRIVFLKNPEAVAPFEALDIPMAKLTEERFNQPWFGSNNLSGVVHPLHRLSTVCLLSLSPA